MSTLQQNNAKMINSTFISPLFQKDAELMTEYGEKGEITIDMGEDISVEVKNDGVADEHEFRFFDKNDPSKSLYEGGYLGPFSEMLNPSYERNIDRVNKPNRNRSEQAHLRQIHAQLVLSKRLRRCLIKFDPTIEDSETHIKYAMRLISNYINDSGINRHRGYFENANTEAIYRRNFATDLIKNIFNPLLNDGKIAKSKLVYLVRLVIDENSAKRVFYKIEKAAIHDSVKHLDGRSFNDENPFETLERYLATLSS